MQPAVENEGPSFVCHVQHQDYHHPSKHRTADLLPLFGAFHADRMRLYVVSKTCQPPRVTVLCTMRQYAVVARTACPLSPAQCITQFQARFARQEAIVLAVGVQVQALSVHQLQCPGDHWHCPVRVLLHLVKIELLAQFAQLCSVLVARSVRLEASNAMALEAEMLPELPLPFCGRTAQLDVVAAKLLAWLDVLRCVECGQASVVVVALFHIWPARVVEAAEEQ
mmetsp:Transcript_6465/g.15333  ORF Transcript_6465/g.15333 Transcript_6465/m.15333 type:complete len:224 (-) Transcript_6465:618-1289(-)